MQGYTSNERKQPEILSIRQAAARGVLPERTLRRLVAQKKIPTIRSGKTQYVNYTLLLEWLSDTESRVYG
jgi:excisionase family DNA binding protein